MKSLIKPLVPSMILVALAAFIFGNTHYLEAHWIKWIYGEYAFAPNINDGISLTNLNVNVRKISADLPWYWAFIRTWSWLVLLGLALWFKPRRKLAIEHAFDIVLLTVVWFAVLAVIAAIAAYLDKKKVKVVYHGLGLILLLSGCGQSSHKGCLQNPVYYDVPQSVLDSIRLGMTKDTIWIYDQESKTGVVHDVVDNRDSVKCLVIISDCFDEMALRQAIDSSFQLLNENAPIKFIPEIVNNKFAKCQYIDESYNFFADAKRFKEWQRPYLEKGYLVFVTQLTRTEDGMRLLGYTPVIQDAQEIYANESPWYDFIVMSDDGFLKGNTAPHEVGHWLGLGHTFDTTPEEKTLLGIEDDCGNFQNYQCGLWWWSKQQSDIMLWNWTQYRKPYFYKSKMYN